MKTRLDELEARVEASETEEAKEAEESTATVEASEPTKQDGMSLGSGLYRVQKPSARKKWMRGPSMWETYVLVSRFTNQSNTAQVDYSTKPEELHDLFQNCGPVKRVTILCDKATGHPKGFAYIEFQQRETVPRALLLHDTEFKGRTLKVAPKRTNIPAYWREVRVIPLVLCFHICSFSHLQGRRGGYRGGSGYGRARRGRRGAAFSPY